MSVKGQGHFLTLVEGHSDYKVKTCFFAETVQSSYESLRENGNEDLKLSEYQRSRSFFDLGQRSLRFQSEMFDFGLYTQVSDSGPRGPVVSNEASAGKLDDSATILS